jgi:predicted small secreted protein
MRYMPSIALLLFLAVFTLLMSGCNTMHGFGKDLQSWTADETHGHNMANEQRRRELYGQ